MVLEGWFLPETLNVTEIFRVRNPFRARNALWKEKMFWVREVSRGGRCLIYGVVPHDRRVVYLITGSNSSMSADPVLKRAPTRHIVPLRPSVGLLLGDWCFVLQAVTHWH